MSDPVFFGRDVKSSSTHLILGLAAGLTLLALTAGVYLVSQRSDRLPAPGSEVSEGATRSFYLGLASLQVGLLDRARQEFTRTTELVAAEPASWANLGLVHLRLGDFDAAQPPIERAAALAPESSEIAFLLGRMATMQGRLEEGIAHLRRAVDLNPRNLQARFTLVQEIERSSGQNADAEAQQELEELLGLEPDNLAVLVERTRLAAKRGEIAALGDSLARLGGLRAAWPATTIEHYDSLQRAVTAQDFPGAARASTFLRNVLLPTPAFQEGRVRVSPGDELIAEPFERFLKLPSPSSMPSPADESLTFSRETVGAARTTPWTAVLAVSLDGSSAPAIFATAGAELRRIDGPEIILPSPSDNPPVEPASPGGLLALDWNHDFRMDLVSAGRGGVRLLVQGEDGTFADATANAAGASTAGLTDCFGAWTADVEMDGDLDIIVGIEDTAPLVLRNNGDGTWRTLQPFAGVSGLRSFSWGDLDGDGDPDAALLDARGEMHLFMNRQAGDFRRVDTAPARPEVIALTVGDANADGVLDIVTLDARGAIRRVFVNSDVWEEQPLATWPDWSGQPLPGTSRLFLADLDNNGALDLAASGAGRSRIWLADERNELRLLPATLDAEIFSVIDLDNDGHLDLVGLSDGRAVRIAGRGTSGYHWQVIRPRAQSVAGDQRINSFGVGGDIEIRSGLLTQKQTIAGTAVHFGLGARTSIDVARIVWPNGVAQAEFDREADQVIVADQRLKGSCPWVFTYDGTGMRFVTDFLWRSPLGLRINAQDTADVTQTEDWVRIRGDQLVPKNDAYDVRITAELWETHFFDHVSLMAVDHPDDVEVFVDERFSSQPPALATRAVTRPRAIARAWDEAGRDVTDLLAHQDGRYLATFTRGPYQGIAQDHFVEFEVGAEVPRDRPLWLVANGWIYPTDSSINVAIGQGQHARPRGLALEERDEAGRWMVVNPDLGFPAGKNKTILIDLNNTAGAGAARTRRLRLRTNLEVYWDWLAVANAVENPSLVTTRLQPTRAELRYRGFSQTSYERRDLPEVPLYQTIANVGQRWRDLIGYYTRFGDVVELLDRVDDRYVIMNAGDELQLSFAVPQPPAAGWRRDFVLIGDGWEKDGDYNTGFSKTVQPLPSHDQPAYGRAVTTLELDRDPVYQRHAADWRTYHTRFVTPRDFLRGVRVAP
ncbi:MAG: tetratricopeptide repeat protein [Luteitalea sp.]|nr:tetratricopeptide repeat protein [Luteitalea sp.]